MNKNTKRLILTFTLIMAFFLFVVINKTCIGCHEEYSYVGDINQQSEIAKNIERVITQMENKDENRSMDIHNQLRIESIFNNNDKINILIRNTGQETIITDNLIIYLGDVVTTVKGCDLEINFSETCTLEITEWSFPQNGITEIIKLAIGNTIIDEFICVGNDKGYC